MRRHSYGWGVMGTRARARGERGRSSGRDRSSVELVELVELVECVECVVVGRARAFGWS